MSWPSQSQVSPFEHLWDILEQHFSHSLLPSTKREMNDILIEAWCRIPPAGFQTLLDWPHMVAQHSIK